MRNRFILLFVVLLFILSACQPLTPASMPAASVVATIVASTLTANATTVVLPQPGPAASAIPALTLTSTPTPTDAPPGGMPAQAAPLPQPAGEVTILLEGSDQRPGGQDFRTDTAVLVVLKPDGSVSLVSFPRDLWVYLPGKFMERINSAQEYGGFALVQSTFQYNFGFTPQSYVLTNFSGFQSIVNSLGGLDVQVGQNFEDARDGYPKGYTVHAGLVHMDGATALWYIRARETTSDLDRLRRAQEVILAIGKKLLSVNALTRIPQLYADFRGAIVTDMTLPDVSALLPRLQLVDSGKIQRYTISADQVTPFFTSGGADVLLPRPDAIRQVLIQAMGK
jgi:polyisoprenyl-teichoic acid--peptidoglycan teichoic acid transferase